MIKRFIIGFAPFAFVSALAQGVPAATPASVPPAALHACGEGAVPTLSPERVEPLEDGPSLTIEFRDAGTQQPIAVRAAVWDAQNNPVSPTEADEHLFQSVFGQSYFYCDGAITLTVRAGGLRITAGRGFEFAPEETTLVVTGDTTVVVELSRFADMNALGWYAGDTHVHISHPPVVYDVAPSQVITVMEAEGLNLVNAMEEEPYFTGALHAESTTNRLLYFSKEERNAHFGHLSILGLKQWFPDDGCIPGHVCGRQLTSSIAELVHAQGEHTLLIATHPASTWDLTDITPWPGGGVWRGMTIDLFGGHVDAVDIMNYTNHFPGAPLDDYTHALNLGLKVAPSAGTDAVLCSGASLPVGGYRVYAQLGAEPLTFENWVDAMRSGKTFVTNYPLITEFQVAGAAPGDSVAHAGGALSGQVTVTCALPFDRIEIIAGSVQVEQVFAAPGTTQVTFPFAVDPGDAGWILARVKGSSSSWHVADHYGLFAQTAPIYVKPTTVASPAPSLANRAAAAIDPVQVATVRFQQFTEQVVDIFEHAEFTPPGRAAFDSMTAHAIDFCKRYWPDPPGRFDLLYPLKFSWPHGRPWVATLTPTFRWERAIDPDPGDRVDYEFHIDTDFAFDNPTVTTGIEDTTFTIPAHQALQDLTIYYWRVVAVDVDGNRRDSSSWATFIVDITATGAGGPTPLAWGLHSAYPNPFNPTLHVAYAVPAGGRDHTLEVFDARGRRVRTLFTGAKPSGVHRVAWDGKDERGRAAPSGVYFVRLRPEGGEVHVRKVVLMK